MKQTWFKKAGWIYLPIHFMGFLVTLAAIACMLAVALSIVAQGRPFGAEVFDLFIYLTASVFWWKWIAEKTSA